MSEAIIIREATLSDAGESIRLFRLLGHAQPPGDDTARFREFLEQGQYVIVAARRDSSILLGAVTLHITHVLHRASPIGRMTAVVVDEAVRGMGIGRMLVEASEKFLAERGCAMVEITSNKRRTDAHAFYAGLGYTPTSFRFAKTITP